MQAGTIVGVGSYTPSYKKADPETGQSPDITPFWMLGGAGAEIAVDIETGRIDVTKLVNVADVGRAINPPSVERQLTGAAIMQARVHALRGDDLQRRPGGERQPRRLQDPGIPRSARRICRPPTSRCRTRTDRSARKGSARRACSVRRRRSPMRCTTRSAIVVTDLPLTPERVLRAIREAEGRPMEDD